MNGTEESRGRDHRDGAGHPTEELDAYADGELEGEAERRVVRHLEECSECRRELALIRTMGDAMRDTMTASEGGVWDSVHRRLTRPAGWTLVVTGTVILAILAGVEWFRAGSLTLEWIATTAIGLGMALLLVSIGREQYREWKSSPYRDLER